MTEQDSYRLMVSILRHHEARLKDIDKEEQTTEGAIRAEENNHNRTIKAITSIVKQETAREIFKDTEVGIWNLQLEMPIQDAISDVISNLKKKWGVE